MKKYNDLSSQVEVIYQEMDKASTQYKEENKIGCPSQCNHCCTNPKVSATPLEMLPLALHLLQNNQVPKNLDSPICIFKTNQCSVYNHRPTVCRLFGWTKVSGKNEPRLSICPKVQTSSGELALNAPDIAYFARKVNELHPSLGNDILPINQSLKQILDIIQMYQNYT